MYSSPYPYLLRILKEKKCSQTGFFPSVVFVIKEMAGLRSSTLAVSLLHPHPQKAFVQPLIHGSTLLQPPECLLVLMLEIWIYLFTTPELYCHRWLLIISVSSIFSYSFYPTLKYGYSWVSFPYLLPSFYSVPEWSHLLTSPDDFKSLSSLKPLSCLQTQNFQLPVWYFL